MAIKTWNLTLEDGPHQVMLEHNAFWGKKRLLIDGGPPQRLGLSGTKGIDAEHPFVLGGHDAIIYIRNNGLSANYDLAIDGLSVDTGQPVTKPPPLPVWGWVFVALCIPLLFGGGLGAGLGVSGGLICYGVSRDVTKPAAARAVICLVVVILCWIVFLALAMTVNGLLHRH